MKHRIETATPAEAASVFSTLIVAFAEDPMVRWTWPDSHGFLTAFPRFAKTFGGAAFAHGSAHCVDGIAAALWLPPNVHPDGEEMGRLFEETMRDEIKADGGGVMEQMMGFHPREPHWYLPLIGVDPVHQGRGIGAALLTHALLSCDRDGVPAYLESSNPRNISLYERHGFERLGRIQCGSSPEVVPMLRKPRRMGAA